MLHPHHKDFSNALILQADWEGGMTNVALDLIDAGKEITKVTLHAGDWIYRKKGIPTVSYDAPLEEFETWLANYIKKQGIDAIILYNQYRPYNVIGWKIAEDLNLPCIVLELGLLRPDFCTIYCRVRNHFDYLEKRWAEILTNKESLTDPGKVRQLKRMSTPCKMTQFALFFLFSRFMAVFARKYIHYKDQRTLSVFHHLKAAIRGGLRFQGRVEQQKFNHVLSSTWSGKYYLVPLQVHTDSQITERSDFKSIEEFITLVADSYEKNAPADTKLIFKVHPMDRGYKDYHDLIKKLRENIGGDRILYLDRIHLPTALDHAKGCITINSTVGLSALIHNTPLITLGEASFNLKGLTYQGSLSNFWTNHGEVCRTHVNNYVALLKRTSQAQGTLYQRLYAAFGKSKIAWPDDFKSLFNQKH